MSEKIDDGGAAFPLIAHTGLAGEMPRPNEGMTLRDYFAAAALQGMCACPVTAESWSREVMAIQAYLQADAMLAARKEGA